mmetsp:Transcript_16731/g.34273  ORF Transcript_16731/g.34273 Transcript_16731/m.34273 type:complete len:80 (+) Transcript_16731:473-712(+)
MKHVFPSLDVLVSVRYPAIEHQTLARIQREQTHPIVRTLRMTLRWWLKEVPISVAMFPFSHSRIDHEKVFSFISFPYFS